MTSDLIQENIKNSISKVDQFDYSKADIELNRLDSVFKMVMGLNQAPYQLRKRDTTLLEDKRCHSVLDDLQSTSNEVSRQVQLETAKKMVRRLVHNIEFADKGTNTNDTLLDSYKFELESKRLQIRELTKEI